MITIFDGNLHESFGNTEWGFANNNAIFHIHIKRNYLYFQKAIFKMSIGRLCTTRISCFAEGSLCKMAVLLFQVCLMAGKLKYQKIFRGEWTTWLVRN